MGEIIAFRTRIEGAARGADVGPNGAEILFFLGVRYERQAPATIPAPKKKRAPRARKRQA